jgi:hypothetical protein
MAQCYTFLTPLYAIPVIVIHGLALVCGLHALAQLIDIIYGCIYFCRFRKCPAKHLFYSGLEAPQPEEMV